jgi:hypothetical protein
MIDCKISSWGCNFWFRTPKGMNFERSIKHLVHYKEVLFMRYIKIMILQEILLLKLVMTYRI